MKTNYFHTFFEKSRLPLAKLLYFMYLWRQDTISVHGKECSRDDRYFPKDSGTDVPILQGRLQHQTYQQPSPVRRTRHRGSDRPVSLTTSQNTRGHRPSNETWVFGIADTSIKPAITYMEAIAKRDKATLLPIRQNSPTRLHHLLRRMASLQPDTRETGLSTSDCEPLLLISSTQQLEYTRKPSSPTGQRPNINSK